MAVRVVSEYRSEVLWGRPQRGRERGRSDTLTGVEILYTDRCECEFHWHLARHMDSPGLLWMAPALSGGGYASEAIAFAQGLELLSPTTTWPHTHTRSCYGA